KCDGEILTFDASLPNLLRAASAYRRTGLPSAFGSLNRSPTLSRMTPQTFCRVATLPIAMPRSSWDRYPVVMPASSATSLRVSCRAKRRFRKRSPRRFSFCGSDLIYSKYNYFYSEVNQVESTPVSLMMLADQGELDRSILSQAQKIALSS